MEDVVKVVEEAGEVVDGGTVEEVVEGIEEVDNEVEGVGCGGGVDEVEEVGKGVIGVNEVVSRVEAGVGVGASLYRLKLNFYIIELLSSILLKEFYLT